MPDNTDMPSASPAPPLRLLDPPAIPAPPPPPSLAYPTTVMLLPAITALAGALIINHIHFDDGLSLMRRTPHWWRMVWHMTLYIGVVTVASGVGVIALCGYSLRLAALRRRTLFLLNVVAIIGGWYLCQPRSRYYAGLETGYAALDYKKLEAECATMPALIAKAPIQRNYLLLSANWEGCRKWWPLLPPYVASLEPQWIYIEPDRVILVLDYRFVEAGTGDNGLYVPLTDAAAFPPSAVLHPIPASPSILRLSNNRWERFRTDTSPYPVFPDVPTPVDYRQPATRSTRH